MNFLLNKAKFVWLIIGCAVISLISSLVVIGTGDLSQAKISIAGYFSIV